MRHARRPLLAGFHPDPSICRAGATYYLVTSTFEYVPGVPLYRSSDLQRWTCAGHVLERRALAGAPASGGIYAPTLRHHAGRFWLAATDVSDGEGHLIVHAREATGSWSEPVRFPALEGIDPDLAWDVDGTCYLTYAGYRAQHPTGIVQAVIDPVRGEILRGPQLICEGSGAQYPEAPHLYRIAGTWYLVLAEGGTERGHMATVARGPSPSGPFESFPGNPFLTSRSTNARVQGTGHADLVQRPDGRWAVVYLGSRPRGGNAGFTALGREVFAHDVEWRAGWPALVAPIEPADPPFTVTDDGVPGARLVPVWIAPRVHPAELVVPTARGWRIDARDPDPAHASLAFVGRRQQHAHIDVRAQVDASGGRGGLSLRIDPLHHYDVELDGSCVRAIAWIGGMRCALAEHALPDATAVTLRIFTEPAAASREQLWFGPDTVVLGYVASAGTIELARVDGRYLTTEVAGGFTGRVVGVYARAGHVLLRTWRYAGRDDAPSRRGDEQTVDRVLLHDWDDLVDDAAHEVLAHERRE